MGIALAANVGGMASPISSPQNIVALGVLNDLNLSVSWPEWFAIALPVCIFIDLAIWVILLVVYRPSEPSSSLTSESTIVVGGGVESIGGFGTSDDSRSSSVAVAGASSRIVSSNVGITHMETLTEVFPPQQASGSHFFEDHPITWTQVYILAVTFITIALWCIEISIEQYVGDMGVIAILPILAFYGTGVLSKDDWNSQLWTGLCLFVCFCFVFFY